MSFLSFFKKVSTIVSYALGHASTKGLTDDIVHLALEWVKVAATKELDNDSRREFVVKLLTNRGIPESVARLATELAVQLAKRELAKV